MKSRFDEPISLLNNVFEDMVKESQQASGKSRLFVIIFSRLLDLTSSARLEYSNQENRDIRFN